MERTEFRSAELTASRDERQTIDGYAAVFNAATFLYTFDGIEYWETVDAGAFDGADLSNVVLRYNHSDNFSILARTSNDTLRLNVDDRGLHIEADIAVTSQGKDIYELIRRKDITKMSYGYIVEKDYIEKVSETKYIRHISKIRKVVDVSVVDLPAYNDTDVEVIKRSVDCFNEEILKSMRKKIELKSKLY
ncbi:HK97 family phage prohead protease [uncultured Selenomonas sp.]|uniref:HK97 family phage prohead protease n=1 Tax=uncultured Selenomonas sp. TaxID=159275 RepID=UPI0028DB82B9|nr:HK97 family phage prohead protease [uncultured Selenomonas sp.]